jgi:hypothetical protein
LGRDSQILIDANRDPVAFVGDTIALRGVLPAGYNGCGVGLYFEAREIAAVFSASTGQGFGRLRIEKARA